MTQSGGTYEDMPPIEREEAEAMINAGRAEEVSRALLRLALHDPEWRYVQGRVLEQVRHEDVWVRRNCATAFGHLARIHRQLELDEVVPALNELADAPNVASWVDAALDDLEIFLGYQR